MKNIGSWGVALVASVALHVAVLTLLIGSRGCSDAPAPAEQLPRVQTDGRANDLPHPTEPDVKPDVKPTVKPNVKPTVKPVEEKKPEHGRHEITPPPEVSNPEPPNREVVWKKYKVRPGDSLTRIARSCGCTVQELAKANKISPTANLWVGQIIKIKNTPADGEKTP